MLEEGTKAKRDEIHLVVQSLAELEEHVKIEEKEFNLTRDLMKQLNERDIRESAKDIFAVQKRREKTF